MDSYEKIKHLRVSELAESDLKVWMMDEITMLANDCGSSLPDDMVVHIYNRLKQKLTTTYRSWHIGTIHASFQTGLTGGYGVFRKVTVQALFHFLKMSQNQMAAQKAIAAEEESARSRRSEFATEDPIAEFLIWATKHRICLRYLDPEHDPLLTRRVSEKIVGISEEYHQAKEMDLLDTLRRRLKDESEVYAERMG